ncbi:uncharacterized protein C6orf132 homolog [Pollicipes pollicipes]|uniref:uncharacterized protein C6orf132 homolog n=1 Tax=Pollicipes pollicipes TaxID=41117 RepID=UPI001884F2BF|nr:uncharacterized protein C6orf132 homolog [Pollicipes pollicipes]
MLEWLTVDESLGAEARLRLVPDDEVILVARVTPAGGTVPAYREARPENEYMLQVRSDGVIVGSDSRISICAGYLPSEVAQKSVHTFLHQDDQMWAAVRQGLMFLFPQDFDSVTVRLISSTNEITYMHVKGDMSEQSQAALPPGHFCTRQVIISSEEARRYRLEEMNHLQQFLRDVLLGKHPREQVHAMLQAIMGPMMGQLNTLVDGPTQLSEPFSQEFNICIFQTLADFSRSVLPAPDVAAAAAPPPLNWSAPGAGGVTITELASEPSSSSPPPPPPPPQSLPPPPPPPPPPPASSAACPDMTLPSHNSGALAPLCVDTYSDSDLHSLLSDCSEHWPDPAAGGPSPATSEFSSATYPSPGSLVAPPRDQTNELGSAQYNACGAFAGASSAQCYASPPAPPAPGPAPNGQTVSPPYGHPVRQSCQFQPAAAPLSMPFQQDVFMHPAPPQQSYLPDYPLHSQEVLLNRHYMAQQPTMEVTPQMAGADLSLELPCDLPLLLTPPTSSNPQASGDDALMSWSQG